MKKIVLLMIIGVLVGSQALFAEDAKAMPARMGRFYLAPSFSAATNSFDTDGNRNPISDGAGSIKMFNLGLAIEYGIIDWITAAVQWAPGWNAFSEVDMSANRMGGPTAQKLDTNLKDFGDIFIGLKTQIVGEKAPVRSDVIRFAIGPGVKVPTGNPDYTEEAAKVFADFGRIGQGNDPTETITVGQIDKHVFGFGARTYFDYIFNKNFSISLFNEFIYYPQKLKIKEYDLTRTIQYMATYQGNYQAMVGGGMPPAAAETAATAAAEAALGGYNLDSKVNYRFDTTFEIETHLDQTVMTAAGKPVLLHLGIPVNLKINPDVKIEGNEIDNSGNMALQLKPNASIFFAGWPVPMQFQLAYNGTVWGENTRSTNTVVAQIRVYFKF